MKYIYLFVVLGSTMAFARDDRSLESFNSKLMNDIDSVMRDNTYQFQKKKSPHPVKKRGRFPASIGPIGQDHELHKTQEDSLTPEK